MIRVSELIKNVGIVFLAVLLTCVVVKSCAEESKIKVIGKINGYELVELEDGHQYLRSNGLYDHSVNHYVDCPKCKGKEE